MTRILSSVLILMLSACSGVNVKQDYDPSVDFSQLNTYAWRSESQEKTGHALADTSLMDARLRNAVDTVLAERGFRKVEREKADFWVAYRYSIEEKTEYDRSRSGVSVGTGTRGSYGAVGFRFGGARDYEQGTLLVDVIHPASDKLMWRGFTRQRLIWRSDPGKTAAKIRETVRAILSKFPPEH